MLKRNCTIASALVASLALLSAPHATSPAHAFTVVPVPFFTPISDCGTVDFAPGFVDLDGDGVPDDCLAWFADSGGAFILDGLDDFDPGDRIFVDGLICNTCLTTCAAGAIFDATISTCPGGGKGGKK